MGLFKIITKPIGCLVSLVGFMLMLAVVLVVAIFLAVRFMLPGVIEGQIEDRTEFSARVGENDTSLLNGRVALGKFTITNPPSYPSSDFIVINELVADLDLDSWNAQPMVLEEVVLDLTRLSWIEDQEGVANLVQFVEALQASLPKTEPSEEPQKETALMIQKLTVRIGKIIVQRNGSQAKEYVVDYDKTFTDVSNFEQLANQIALDLARDGLLIFRDVLMDYILDHKVLDRVTEQAKGLTETAVEGGKKVLEGGKDAVGEARDKLKDLF